jgi:hypothetical protein
MEPPAGAHINLSKNYKKFQSLRLYRAQARSKSGVRLPNFARPLQQKMLIEIQVCTQWISRVPSPSSPLPLGEGKKEAGFFAPAASL